MGGEDIQACVKLGLHSEEDVGALALCKILMQEFIRFFLTGNKVWIYLKPCYYNIQDTYTYNAKYNSSSVAEPIFSSSGCHCEKVQTTHENELHRL